MVHERHESHVSQQGDSYHNEVFPKSLSAFFNLNGIKIEKVMFVEVLHLSGSLRMKGSENKVQLRWCPDRWGVLVGGYVQMGDVPVGG